MSRCTTIKNLERVANEKSDAIKIRKIWKSESLGDLEKIDCQLYRDTTGGLFNLDLEHVKKLMIDSVINTHGIEYLGYHKRQEVHVDYCNAGDTYTTTIIFMGDNLVVGCWGDLVEKNLIEHACGF